MKTISENNTYSKNDLCWALDIPRATYYRFIDNRKKKLPKIRRPSPRKLSEHETSCALNLLNSEKNIDKSPKQIYFEVLDEGDHFCSISSFYRILKENKASWERRKLRCAAKVSKPELIATMPNQVWSWDVSKLKGPRKFEYFYLYTIIDIFSKLVVGWTVADTEESNISKKLFEASFKKQKVQPDMLIVHSDRGAIMTSDRMQKLYDSLRVKKSLNRPYVSNDNPFSEANFKTLKYRPNYPERFVSLLEADQYLEKFYSWYNNTHYHSSINMLTPHDVHYGKQEAKISKRNETMDAARLKHPERFLGNTKKHSIFEGPVYINKPKETVS